MTTTNIDDVLAQAGTLEQRRSIFADYVRRVVKLDGMLAELVKHHPYEWVALTEGDDLFFARNIESLRELLKEAGKSPNRHVAKYLDPEPNTWIL